MSVEYNGGMLATSRFNATTPHELVLRQGLGHVS